MHLLLALPLLKHFWGARDHHPTALAMEIPIEVVEPERKPAHATRKHGSARRDARPAPVPAPIRQPTPAAEAQTRANLGPSSRAALHSPNAAPVPPHAPTAAADSAEPREPSALAASWADSVMGKHANVLLIIHSAPLRDTSFGKELNKLLRERPLLSPFFVTSQLDPLRDFDHVLLARSEAEQDATPSAVLQYNVPRYKIRVAPASLGDSAFALPAPQILVVAQEASEAASHLPHDFRVPESTGDEAFALYVKAPAVVSLSTLPALPTSLRWLTLTLHEDGSGAVTFSAADDPATEPVTGHAHVAKSELRATCEALLDAAQ